MIWEKDVWMSKGSALCINDMILNNVSLMECKLYLCIGEIVYSANLSFYDIENGN